MRMIDLSAPIEAGPAELPDPLRTDITFRGHAEGAAEIERLLGVPARLLRDGEGWATDEFTRFGTHNSTHVDAPWHYNSEIDGARAETIDELPIEWFFQDAVVLDMTAKADGDAVTATEVEAALTRIGHTLRPLEIVLVRTDRDAFYESLDYIARGPGVSAEATRWLYDRGVRVMGIDAWGWDAPLHLQASAATTAGERGIFWAAHQAGLRYAQIERLVNLRELPPDGFKLACFPLKLVGGSAGPARPVALLPD